MIRTILVPLDGSRFAETALPLARELARRTQANLRLVSAHEPRPDITPGLDAPALEAQNLEIRNATQAYLTEVAAGLAGVAAVSTEVVDGAAGPAVTNAVQRIQPDLVVMSTHGRGPLSRFWLGSVADHLIRHVTVPVLLVRPPGAGQPAPEPAVHRMLVALDLSEESRAIVRAAAPLARAFGASVTLLHVVEPIVGIVDGALPFPIPVDASMLDTRKRDAEDRLARVADALRAEGLSVSTRVFVGVGAAPTILEEQAKGGHDLIAMTTHGAGGVRRFLVGSVADKVIRGTVHPVLVLRAPGTVL